MAAQQQLQFNFDASRRSDPPSAPGNSPLDSQRLTKAPTEAELQFQGKQDLPPLVLKWDFRTTFPQPLDEAIDAGKLHDTDMMPENLRGLHLEHERVALAYLQEHAQLADAQLRGVDAKTGKPPSSEKQRIVFEAHLPRELERLKHAFEVLIDVYTEGFGNEAAEAFRKAVHARHHGINVLAETPPPRVEHNYARGHPWFYYAEGDGAAPVPLDSIEPAELTVEQLAGKLPKCPVKRREKLESMLREATSQAVRDEERYQELITRGAEALSHYDRTIAYGGNDPLGWASAMAFAFNHVRYSRGQKQLLLKLLKPEASRLW